MFPEPSVKSITKFIQIFLEIFVSNTMKGPIEKGFHITNHDMDQRQPERSLFRRSYFLIMLVGFVNDVHSWKGIGTNLLAMIKMMLKKAFNQTLKSLPSGQGQSSEALPSERPDVTPR